MIQSNTFAAHEQANQEGLYYKILKSFLTPIEVLLRWNFGERYLTRANFTGGLVVLFVFSFFTRIIGTMFGGLFKSSSATTSHMSTVIFIYVLVSGIHFLIIWWKDATNKPEHSHLSGRSFLLPIGKGIMWVLNLVLDNIVRAIFKIHPKLDEQKLPRILPVLQDANVFTERFVEPCFCFYLALRCFAHGQMAMGWWLIISVMALNLFTGLRHQAERWRMLDYRDSMLEMEFYHSIINGRQPVKSMPDIERMVRKTADAVDENPAMLTAIKDQDATLAAAVEQVNARRSNKQQPNADFEAIPQAV